METTHNTENLTGARPDCPTSPTIRIKTCRNCERQFPTADRAVGVALCSPACEKQYFSNPYDYRQSPTFDRDSSRPRVAPSPPELRKFLLRHADDEPIPAAPVPFDAQGEIQKLQSQITELQCQLAALAKTGTAIQPVNSKHRPAFFARGWPMLALPEQSRLGTGIALRWKIDEQLTLLATLSNYRSNSRGCWAELEMKSIAADGTSVVVTVVDINLKGDRSRPNLVRRLQQRSRGTIAE